MTQIVRNGPMEASNEVFIAKKKNQVESLLLIPNGAPILPYKIAMELGALFELHFIPTTTSRQPQAFPYSCPPAPNHATTPWSFFVCSMFPIPNVLINLLIKSYTTTMSSINLHNAKKMIFLIVRSLRLYFYAMPATTGWIRQHSMPNLTIALTKPRLKTHNCGSQIQD